MRTPDRARVEQQEELVQAFLRGEGTLAALLIRAGLNVNASARLRTHAYRTGRGDAWEQAVQTSRHAAALRQLGQSRGGPGAVTPEALALARLERRVAGLETRLAHLEGAG